MVVAVCPSMMVSGHCGRHCRTPQQLQLHLQLQLQTTTKTTTTTCIARNLSWGHSFKAGFWDENKTFGAIFLLKIYFGKSCGRGYWRAQAAQIKLGLWEIIDNAAKRDTMADLLTW